MKQVIFTAIAALLVVCSPSLQAKSVCMAKSAAISASNNWVLLGGNAKGNVQQVVAGEFGKDVDSQKRVLGQFDRCGSLLVADISYDKNERNVAFSMEQHISRVQGGWVAEYAYLVKVIRQGKEEVVDNRQGTVSWHVGRHGTITSSSDRFTSMGKNGFTDITYHYDPQLRLQNSVARGSDEDSNGVNRYRWNAQGQVTNADTERSKNRYTYDSQRREWKLDATEQTSVSMLHSADECQLWDETGNCTLSYLHETEVFAQGVIERHLTSAYRYQYWGSKSDNQ